MGKGKATALNSGKTLKFVALADNGLPRFAAALDAKVNEVILLLSFLDEQMIYAFPVPVYSKSRTLFPYDSQVFW